MINYDQWLICTRFIITIFIERLFDATKISHVMIKVEQATYHSKPKQQIREEARDIQSSFPKCCLHRSATIKATYRHQIEGTRS